MNKDLTYVKLMLEDISTIADKVTSGNVSHNIATIKCDARKALECLDFLQEEPNTYKLKFNVGDTIKDKDGYEVTIENIGDDCYFVDKAQACIKFSTQDQWELVEEPVSEELEEAVEKSFIYHDNRGDDFRSDKQIETAYRCGFETGAKWQKEKDESVTKDLEEYINELSKQFPEVSFAKLSRIAVRAAKWQKEHLWKPADGDDLPEIDREVVVLTQPYPLENSEYAVSFAHRPNPNGWDGKSLSTGKVEHYTPKTYDKGGWNIPDVKYWLDAELPKEIEL